MNYNYCCIHKQRTHEKTFVFSHAHFSKHAETSLVPRLNLVWNSIPMQLAKKNKKYIYGQVRKGSRAKYFELAIQWLLGCGLIHKVQRAGKNFDYSVGSESGGKFEGKKPESVL